MISKEQRKKMIAGLRKKGAWNKGIKTPFYVKEKLSKAHSKPENITKAIQNLSKIKLKKGIEHWNWKGGIYPLIYKLRHCIEYKLWRTRIFERDNYVCVLCKDKSGDGTKVILNADHFPETFSSLIKKNNIKTYEEAISCRELWDINNGRTLCHMCHKQETSIYQKSNWINQYPKNNICN